MKKVWIIFAGLMLFSLVAGASYPAPEFESADLSSVALSDDDEFEYFSQKNVCGIMKGCWKKSCFPNGYRTEETYCGYETSFFNGVPDGMESVFHTQKDVEKSCNNSFECKSNFCFNGECIDTMKTVDDGIVRIDKSDLEELRSIIKDAENSMEENYSEEVSKSFFGSLLDWFRNIFKV